MSDDQRNLSALPLDVPRLENTHREDGETWESYARRLEKRIKAQRDHIVSLHEVHAQCSNRANRKRMAHLEAALGRAALRIDRQNEAIKHLVAERKDADV